jgi:hypothetical protein
MTRRQIKRSYWGLAALVLAVVAAAIILVAATPRKGESQVTVQLVGAGDIASNGNADVLTGNLIEARPTARVFTAGDNAYPNGSASDFTNKYHPAWGAFTNRTYPTPGNHDYYTFGASGYTNYFDPRTPAEVRFNPKYYAYTYGDWRIYALDSNVSMARGSPQYNFVANDMNANGARCEMAYYHHATVSTGSHGNQAVSRYMFGLFDDKGGDLIVAGHDHNYERFSRINAIGQAWSLGVYEIVVGTGGTGLRSFTRQPLPTTVVRNASTHGILDLSLAPTGFSGSFVPADGTFRDSFSGTCL